MPKFESEELIRRHVWLYARDVERTELLFGNSLGVSKALRLMIRKFLDSVEAKGLVEAKHPKVEAFDMSTVEELRNSDRDPEDVDDSVV